MKPTCVETNAWRGCATANDFLESHRLTVRLILLSNSAKELGKSIFHIPFWIFHLSLFCSLPEQAMANENSKMEYGK